MSKATFIVTLDDGNYANVSMIERNGKVQNILTDYIGPTMEELESWWLRSTVGNEYVDDIRD